MDKPALAALIATFTLAGCMKDKQRAASPIAGPPTAQVARPAKAASAPPPPTTRGAAKAKAPARAVLTLAKLRFMFRDPSGVMREVMSLEVDGTVVITSRYDKRSFKLQADGKLLQGGRTLAEIDRDGVIHRKDGPSKVRVSVDGVLEGGPKPVGLAADGTFTYYPGKALQVKVMGLTKQTRRTAMYLLAVMFLGQVVWSSP